MGEYSYNFHEVVGGMLWSCVRSFQSLCSILYGSLLRAYSMQGSARILLMAVLKLNCTVTMHSVKPYYLL